MYILILTLLVAYVDGAGGGVAMQEFDTKESCIKAGEAWASISPDLKYRYMKRHLIYRCTPK